ncbi:uncharacterized protein [Atheta coriaria]|uniref:uncharacterized protein n=1 Tax=Dalotia coriaria TaxID=877792 RepID=UPI0031F3CDDD
MLCLPPHCTHRLQPLDVSVMRPASIAYSDAVKKWLREHPGRVVTANDIPRIYGEAFKSAAKSETIKNIFKKTGIWPFNRSVYSDEAFVAAGTSTPKISSSNASTATSTAIEQVNVADEMTNDSDDDGANDADDDDEDDGGCGLGMQRLSQSFSSISVMADEIDNSHTHLDGKNIEEDEQQQNEKIVAHSSRMTADEYEQQFLLEAYEGQDFPDSDEEPEKKRKLDGFNISPRTIFPLMENPTTHSNSRRKSTAVLTSSPYRQTLVGKKHQPKIKILVRSIKGKGKGKEKSKKSVDDTACIFCRKLYSDSVESWIQCGQCTNWAQDSCAGVEGKVVSRYTCNICK